MGTGGFGPAWGAVPLDVAHKKAKEKRKKELEMKRRSKKEKASEPKGK